MKCSRLVSVAMATYNGELFLQQQLGSIIRQTYNNIELIIVDDCSTDNTKDILTAFAEKYRDDFKVNVFFNEKNIGFVKNFEKALTYCKGDYIALCDQDDIWEPNKIERLIDEINDYSLIYSDVSLIDAEDGIISKSRAIDNRINNHTGISFSELVFKNYVIGCSAMFRRDLLDLVLPIPNDVLFHDWWIAILASKLKGIKYLQESLILYRQHENNVIGHTNRGLIDKISYMLKRSTVKSNELSRKFEMLKVFCKIDGLSEFDKQSISLATAYYESYLQNKSLFFHWLLTILLYPRLRVKKTILEVCLLNFPKNLFNTKG